MLISNDKIATTPGECHDCTRRRGISEINMIRSLYMVGTNFLEIQSSRIGAHLDWRRFRNHKYCVVIGWMKMRHEWTNGNEQNRKHMVMISRRNVAVFKSPEYCGLLGCYDLHTIFLVESHCLDFHFWIISRTCLWSSQSLYTHLIVLKPLKFSIPEIFKKFRAGSGEIAEAGFACLV